jgi:hypothetical protein
MEAMINARYASTVISLSAANNYNQSLGRIQLQKYIYLTDTISIIWEILAPRLGHESYKHGPFDSDIQNAVDVLAFRGFIDVVSVNVENKNKIEAEYRINNNGLKLCKALSAKREFQKKMNLYIEVAKQVEKRGWNRLRELVYSEPSYIKSIATGWGYKFDYSNILKNDSLKILFDFEKMLEKDKKMTKENFVSIFFRILD